MSKRIFWNYIPVYMLKWKEFVKGEETYFSETLFEYDRDKEEWEKVKSIEFADPEAAEHLEIPEFGDLWEFDLPQKVEDKLNQWKKEGTISGYDVDAPYIGPDAVFPNGENQEEFIDGRDYQKDMAVVAVLVEAPEDKMKKVKKWFQSIDWSEIEVEQ